MYRFLSPSASLSELFDITATPRDAMRQRRISVDDDRPTDPKVPEIAEAVIAKNRRGRTGIVKIGFQGAYQRFVAVKDAEEAAFGGY